MKLYLSHFPHNPKKVNYVEKLDKLYRISFNINDREYIVITNLSKKAVTISLSEGEYIRFLDEDCMDIILKNDDRAVVVEPYDTLCFYKMKDTSYELLGGGGHVFSGSEIKSFEVSGEGIKLELSQRVILKEAVHIKVPKALKGIRINGLELIAHEVKGLNIVKYDWGSKG